MHIYKQVLLVIFDGWGIGKNYPGNAIEKANKPFFDSLWQNYPHAEFEASGEAIGLPDKNIGSSEIAHTIIGAGSVIDTDLIRLNKLSKNDQLDQSPAIQQAFDHVKKNNSVLHLCGQVSPGGVHSHQEHLFALLRAAKKHGLQNVAIHVFTDGRDTPPTSGHIYIKQLEDQIKQIGVGFIATLQGRYYAMDRDNNWERLKYAEDAIFKAEGRKSDLNPAETLKKLYSEGEEDEFIKPIIFKDKDDKSYPLSTNDSIIFFNFRADRARMLDKKIAEKVKSDNLCFVTMTEHDSRIDCLVAYPPIEIKTTLAKEISKSGLTQAHIAETEKYAHLTFFLNGGRNEPFPNEEDVLIESKKGIATHDLYPQMRCQEIAEKAIEFIDKGTNLVVLNFANPDMVGHTGNMEATIKAIEYVDKALKQVVEKIIAKEGVAFITADHGNAEVMIDEENGEKITAHSINPVPGIITDKNYRLREGGGLSDVAPTVLQLLGIDQPQEMTGKSLLEPV